MVWAISSGLPTRLSGTPATSPAFLLSVSDRGDHIYTYTQPRRCQSETSVGDHSSVDRQRCADDVGCLVRANEHDGICNFFGSADALVGNLCVEEICFVFL